jgi:hypothetical protein
MLEEKNLPIHIFLANVSTPLSRISEPQPGNHCFRTIPVGCCIVAVVWEEVIIEFPEDMKGNATIRSQNIMISFSEHGIIIIQSKML